jgi:hypothetical protein
VFAAGPARAKGKRLFPVKYMEEDIMKASVKRLLPLVLMAGSTLAFASAHLTREECNSYPLKPAHGAITSADTSRELAELALVGYRPGIDNYSPDIGDARNRLHALYVKDCLPNQSAASNSSTNG